MACQYDSTYPFTKPRKSKSTLEFDIGIITDLDKAAKTITTDGKTLWKSLLQKGTLVYNYATKDVFVEMQPEGKAVKLYSEFSRGGRGMELSELVAFNGNLYTVDDRTGIVYQIADDKAIPWAILADGNGKVDSGFKSEWMCVKDEKLLVGGHGKEFMGTDGHSILHRNYMWVKVITKEGGVTHFDWIENYKAMRDKAGCSYPGYLTHESGVWSEKWKQWFFLPRKASPMPYDHKKDESNATNMLIRCSEDFKDITVTRIGELTEPTRGYSTFKFIPGTDDKVIIAIKSEEVGDAQKSFLTCFTIDGEVLLPDKPVSSSNKYEGIEFI